ncbi:MAG: PIN domain-containing protein [Gammaproteobacteria bacterium]
MYGGEAFLDTNILLYLLSSDDAKADRAEEVIAGGGVISVQVLNEFASVATRKLAMQWLEVRDILAQVRAVCAIEPLTVEGHDRAMLVSERHSFHIYDAMVVASALLAGCSTLYTEDMQDGQLIDGQLTIRNPFVADEQNRQR